MTFKPIPLPYEANALEPAMSEKTVRVHYEKHHQGYADTLNDLVQGSDFAGMDLWDIVRATASSTEYLDIFNNAAQVANHDLFWYSLSPNGGNLDGTMLERVKGSFGEVETFKDLFKDEAVGVFGSGWVWLLAKPGGQLRIETTGNAKTPVMEGETPLIALDVWEHAYYLDHQNQRDAFVQTFLDKLINWDFAESTLKKLEAGDDKTFYEELPQRATA